MGTEDVLEIGTRAFCRLDKVRLQRSKPDQTYVKSSFWMLGRIFSGIWSFRPIIFLAMIFENFQEFGNKVFKDFHGWAK